ncbi:MAG: secondary thiamine-phosphate synthase enzyme YjbQ [Candidatus Euphemobacter frigidus]|nr:secondary thiamine-phosphate synthase enzyme YjbQ [Candidatus Euphemobacter frigidus]MDP8275963.1 secondary thiamine-phosphate synthase enzyme YjbQ [Candidatus Euphemobacter frigidus]
MIKITLKTNRRSEMVDITARVERVVEEAGFKEGACIIFIPHTTAGVTINENADPSVQSDIQAVLSRMVPAGAGYSHLEGNADSHIKAGLMGSSVCVLVEGGKLQLGTWQGIFFCEFDGPRHRQVWVSFLRE